MVAVGGARTRLSSLCYNRTVSKTQLLEQIRGLSREERTELLEGLLETFERPEELERLLAEEAMRRYEDMKNGKVKGLTHEEFMRDV